MADAGPGPLGPATGPTLFHPSFRRKTPPGFFKSDGA